MNSANTTPASAGIGEERAMPMPAPRIKAAIAIDLPRKPVAQLRSVVYIVWNSVPVVPASAEPAASVRTSATVVLRTAVLRVLLISWISSGWGGGKTTRLHRDRSSFVFEASRSIAPQPRSQPVRTAGTRGHRQEGDDAPFQHRSASRRGSRGWWGP